jgi:hypothetical protein
MIFRNPLSKHRLAAVIFIGLFVALALWLTEYCIQRIILNERMNDVKHLREAYDKWADEHKNKPDLSELIAILAHDEVKLNNPIAIDPNKPCYNLVWNNDHPGMAPRIIETNVKADQLVVASENGVWYLLPKTSKR